MATKRFKAILGSDDPGSLFIEIPFDVKAVFGTARPKVVVTVNDHSYRSTVSVYGGRSYLPVRKSNRDAAKVAVGDEVNVRLELDEEPRVVEVPTELAAALRKNTALRAAWAKLSHSHQREHADAITSAKKEETRARRVAKAIEMLTTPKTNTR